MRPLPTAASRSAAGLLGVALLLFTSCGGDGDAPQHLAAGSVREPTAAPTPSPRDAELEEARAAFLDAETGEQAVAAFAALEEALDRAPLAPTAGADAYLAAFDTLLAAERAGWKPRIPAMQRLVREWRRLAARPPPADGLEVALVQRLLVALEAGDAPEEGLFEEIDSAPVRARLVESRERSVGWVWILLARGERLRGRAQQAFETLALARTRLDRGPDDPLQRGYIALEEASCQERLGRFDASARALARARTALDRWQPADGAGDADRRALFEGIVLGRVRLASNAERHRRVLALIDEFAGRIETEAVRSQLDYYAALSLRRGPRPDEREARTRLEAALSSAALPRTMRALAQLERAQAALDRRDRDGAAEALAAFEELARGQGEGEWPLARARAGVLGAQLLALDADSREALLRAREVARESYHRFLASWTGEVDAGGVGILGYPPRRRLVEQVIDLCLEAESGPKGVRIAFEEAIAARAVGALARALTAPAPTAEELRRELLGADEEGLLVWIPGHERTHAFWLTRAELLHVPLAPLEDLRSLVDAAWSALTTSSVGSGGVCVPFEEAQAALAAALFPAELAERVRTARRTWAVGADLLGRFPLEALTLPGEDAAMGLVREVATLPSAAVGLALARRARGRPPRPGPVTIAYALDPREGSGEAAALLARLRGELGEGPRYRWRTGAGARLGDMLRTAPRDSAWLVVAHGVRDPGRLRPQGIALAPEPERADGRWFAGEIAASARAEGGAVPPRVLLAVCDAVSGQPRLGSDEADHLAADLIEAGANAVAVSPVPLVADSTLRLAELTLVELERGAGLGEALRRARVAYLEARPRAHPREWATWGVWGFDLGSDR